jgi:hypothetical protein
MLFQNCHKIAFRILNPYPAQLRNRLSSRLGKNSDPRKFIGQPLSG